MDRYNVGEALNVQLGQAGSDYVTNETVNQTNHPGVTWVAIQALSVDAVVSATSVDTNVWDSISGLEVPAGTTIYGRWSVITIGSGDTAICYRG